MLGRGNREVTPKAARERRRSPRSRRVLLALGALLVVMAADIATGALLAGSGRVLPSDRGDLAEQVETSARQAMQAPNIRGEPWSEQMGAELARFQLEDPSYVPYLVSAPHDFEGRHLNVTDGARTSYRPAIVPGVPPLDIAFLGGSTVFGIGQRDEHTIPSEFARLAEDAGITVRVHNLGLPAWVRWQELQYLERRLGAGERFDLVVFYDGYNEFLVQRTEYADHPTHYGASTLQSLAEQYFAEHGSAPTYGSGLSELGRTYRRNSALLRFADRVLGTEPAPAWVPPLPTASAEQQATAAMDIYTRAHGMTVDLAASYGIPLHVYWQPTQPGWSSDVIDQLPPDVVDLSRVLDGREEALYISEVHTNEEGARLVARAIWDDLESEVGQLANSAERR